MKEAKMQLPRTPIGILGSLGGLVFAIGSFLRYYVAYVDYDRALVYPLIGLFIVFVAWIYDRLVRVENTLEQLENYLADESKSTRRYTK